MMQTIYLTKDQVPAHLRNGYSGNKFKARVTGTVDIPSTAGLWEGGSRTTHQLIRLSDGALLPLTDVSAPWDNLRQSRNIALEPGIAVIEHSIFCGKDMGLTFCLHPDDVAAMLPAPVADLSDIEKLVLNATKSFKSSYGGKDRYQMACDELRYGAYAGKYAAPTRAQWDAAKQSLIARGYLNKAGAITVSGRNAIG